VHQVRFDDALGVGRLLSELHVDHGSQTLVLFDDPDIHFVLVDGAFEVGLLFSEQLEDILVTTVRAIKQDVGPQKVERTTRGQLVREQLHPHGSFQDFSVRLSVLEGVDKVLGVCQVLNCPALEGQQEQLPAFSGH